MHPIRCTCGTVRGQLEGTGAHSRLICYCTDCRAFAVFLGRAAEILDKQGGTEIVQVAQPRLRILAGYDRLSAVRLSEKGLVRWYASCCNTPIGNTVAEPRISFIGLIHLSLDRAQMNGDFGKRTAIVNSGTALGETKPKQRGLFGVIARFVWIIVGTRVSGRYKNSQLFDGSGSLRVAPSILTPQDLARLKRAS
jgi:hypothetical protein